MHDIARTRHGLVTRADVLACGGTDEVIRTRTAVGRWTAVHPGVYLVGVAPPPWRTSLLAATLAAGPGSAASHRAAVVLWGLDGIATAPLELTVPFTAEPLPADVIQHRTRRPVPIVVIDAVPVTSIERTILDAAGCLRPVAAEKGMECALRRGLTTATALDLHVKEHGGRGVRGSGFLKELLAERPAGRAAGSPAEVELLRALRLQGVEPPVRQHPVRLRDGSVAILDMAWPLRRKAVEVDGVDAHATIGALDHDDERQNQVLEAGYDLRRYSARAVRRRPGSVVASVMRFLAA